MMPVDPKESHLTSNTPLTGLEATRLSEPTPDTPENELTAQSDLPTGSTLDPTREYRLKIGAGTVIGGRYTLQEKIGEGGMGEVWIARQVEPVKRKVAIKLIKSGMDSAGVLARFEHERQALALMDHPNIARVFDGGLTPTGQPYFVMEVVNGLPLTRFCDEARLTPRQRLQLFIPICQAVQHAHQKGIVHRDLKPANILVTMVDGNPVPKVIDFGVSKATGGKLTDQTMSTQFGAIVGTLEYMSPEQAGFSNVDVDTRTDIYSLGVILYEMLTGLKPIDARRLKKAAVIEMVRILHEEEPARPSTRLSTDDALPSLAALRQMEPRKLMSMLRGELDWVVMKCLEKSRDRRYETANALSRDIQRYLSDEPVEARPPSTGYRLRKFFKRNSGTVLAACLILMAMIGGIIGTTVGLVRARQAEQLAVVRFNEANEQRKKADKLALAESEQRRIADQRRTEADQEKERADRNFRTARDAVDRMLTRVAEELRGHPQTEHVRRALLDDAFKFYQGFLKEKGDDPTIRYETALASLRVGNLYSFLGQWNDSIERYRDAMATLTELLKGDPQNASYRERVAEGSQLIARACTELHLYDEAFAGLTRSAEVWDRLRKEWPDRPIYLQNAAQANWEIAIGLRGRYLFGKSGPYMNRRNELLAELGRRFPDFVVDEKLKAGAMAAIPADQARPDQKDVIGVPLGRDYANLPHDLATLKVYEEEIRTTLAYWSDQMASHPDVPAYQRTFAKACGNLSTILLAQQRFDELVTFMESQPANDDMAARFPDNVEYQVTAAWDAMNRGNILFLVGRKAEARESYRRAIDICKKVSERFPDELRHHVHLVGVLLYCPDPELREPARAVEEARKAFEMGGSHMDQGEWALAQLQAGMKDQALATLLKAREKDPNDWRLQFTEASIRLAMGQKPEAELLFKKAMDVADNTANRFWYSLQLRFLREEFLARLNGELN